jgi:alanine dehydrogenase
MLHDVVHYAVGNMPGAVPHTSTYALTNATLPFVIAVAQKGPRDAVTSDESLAFGLNVAGGAVTNQPVAEALNLSYVAPAEAVK